MANGNSLNIVLVHGFPGFPKLGKFEYFKGVEKHLKSKFKSDNIKIRIPRIGAVETIPKRAEALKKDIDTNFKGEPVHIIAHSGGGLDARYVASPGGLGSPDGVDSITRISSITTISAPHHGALAADLLSKDRPGSADDIVRRLFSEFSAARRISFMERFGVRGARRAHSLLNRFRGTVPDAVRLVKELVELSPEAIRGFTTKQMAAFNNEVEDAENVKYSSYAGVSGLEEKDVLAPIFYPSHLLLLLEGERNDGWVTVESAKWTNFNGEFKGEIPADHLDQIGHDLSLRGRLDRFLRPRSFDHLAFYEQIVRDCRMLDARSHPVERGRAASES